MRQRHYRSEEAIRQPPAHRRPTLAGTSVLVDFNRDGHVNVLDLGIAKRNLNHTLPLLPVTVLMAQVAFAPGLFSDGDASLTHRLADEILA